MSALSVETSRTEELDYELWDGEKVVRGRPSNSHEAIRAALIIQLGPQCPPGFVVLTSSSIEDAGTAPRSDGAVLSPEETLVWVEVLSPSDLRQGDARLVSERRRHWLFDHGVRSLWVLVETFEEVTFTVIPASGPAEAFVSPAVATVSVVAGESEHRFAVDLAKLAAAASVVGTD